MIVGGAMYGGYVPCEGDWRLFLCMEVIFVYGGYKHVYGGYVCVWLCVCMEVMCVY